MMVADAHEAVLRGIRVFVRQQKVAPTIRELATLCKKSPNAIKHALGQLEKAGKIELVRVNDRQLSRGIVLKSDA